MPTKDKLTEVADKKKTTTQKTENKTVKNPTKKGNEVETSNKDTAETKPQNTKEKQPIEYPSAGSTFKRPIGNYAGTLIEQNGLKGFSVGGAKVSEKHAGFIVNFNTSYLPVISTMQSS